MREELVAWAGDCVVRGPAELPEGRLSDAVNALDLLHLSPARLEALDDGRVLDLDELEVDRRDLHLVLVEGREGDPAKKVRTVREQVVLEVGPFVVHGHLHRPPASPALAALTRFVRFVPVTEASFTMRTGGETTTADVLLVNRDLIAKSALVDVVPSEVLGGAATPPPPAG